LGDSGGSAVFSGFSGLVSIGFLRPGGGWSRLGGSGELRRASGTPQEPQGRPRSSLEMSSASFRKNRFFGLGRRLAASEGAKIVGGASLARRENPG
jgi:hypothetical protein